VVGGVFGVYIVCCCLGVLFLMFVDVVVFGVVVV